MNFRNISAWSIRNPVVPIVLFLALTIAGIVSFMNMKIQGEPDIEFPGVIISISQPGAAPTEIETQITQRVESAVRTIQGIQSISSSAREGNSQTVVEFRIGTDVNEAVNEVKNAIDQVRGELPDGILEPQVVKMQTSSQPIGYFAVSADDMTHRAASAGSSTTPYRKPPAVDSRHGRASIAPAGWTAKSWSMLDPARMQSLGVTASQINSALRQININAAGGQARNRRLAPVGARARQCEDRLRAFADRDRAAPAVARSS